MKFRYNGEAHLENFLGFDWDKGSVHDVTDDYAVRKIGNNPNFHPAETAKVGVIASPVALQASIEAETKPVEIPQMPRRTRGPNKPKPVLE